jgi:hypothetical protein
MRMNDLHTATLTAEIAAATGAAALVNEELDRNDVDLNRISDAHDGAPWFLERLHELVATAIAQHGRCTLLTIHGWNVVQPAVDVGLGCTPGPDPFAAGTAAAVSPAFAADALRAFADACAAHGISTTVGARYPARARENLLQLFTRRHRGDPRPLVRALADLGRQVDAMQLELSLALRYPGPWRDALRAACLAALPSLHAPGAAAATGAPAAGAADPPGRALRLQLTAPAASGLVAVDRVGARFLLFPPAGGLFLYTGERTGVEAPHAVGPLVVEPRGGGGLALRFRGPMLRFPDTTPFLDLEAGLARADLVDADVQLDVHPDHTTIGGAEFGRAAGTALIDGSPLALDGDAFFADEEAGGPWPRLRAAFRVGPRDAIAVTLGLADGEASGFLCRAGVHVPIAAGRVVLGADGAPLDRFRLSLELASGERLEVEAHAVQRLPVIRAVRSTPIRIEFAACRLAGDDGPAGWCELGGV